MNQDQEYIINNKPHFSQDDAEKLAQELAHSAQKLGDEAFEVVINSLQRPSL